MAISVFPSGGGEFVTNDFVVDINDTTNNVIDLGRGYASGAYEISLASGDTSFDIYALDADGDSVGYTKDATLVTTGEFETVVILGVAQDERITFAFAGASNDATSEGNATGAGAYLVSINPSDLPTIDDTANVVGGNFATDVEIYFESGTVSTEAKNVVRSDSTALVVTRPDNLDAALDPWDVKAINPGVTPPTGSDAHILAGTVDAGAVPVWQTTSPLPSAIINQAYSATVVATDADGTVNYSITAGSLPTGLSFNGTTGVISGTPTASGNPFTIAALDDGGNSNEREFDLPVLIATGGSISTVGNYTVHTFDSSGDFETFAELTDVEYIILSGGGGGGAADSNTGGGGGGGGGLLSSVSGFASGSATSALSSETISVGTLTVTVGSGGAGSNNTGGNAGASGSDSSFGTIGTAIGGGGGGDNGDPKNGKNGGCGGGGASIVGNAGTGTAGQGFSGAVNNGFNVNDIGGGGGGTSSAATNGNSINTDSPGGDGTSNFLDERGWGAGGGAGHAGDANREGSSAGGSDGNDQTTYAGDGGDPVSVADGGDAVPGFGGGGGGAGTGGDGGNGGSGKVVIRYEA